jgi:hypothetical protein
VSREAAIQYLSGAASQLSASSQAGRRGLSSLARTTGTHVRGTRAESRTDFTWIDRLSAQLRPNRAADCAQLRTSRLIRYTEARERRGRATVVVKLFEGHAVMDTILSAPIPAEEREDIVEQYGQVARHLSRLGASRDPPG